jgi:hypothetical protein
MDYAEQYRLATNIIHPPLLGVTLQVSDFKDGEIDGGVFAANVDGEQDLLCCDPFFPPCIFPPAEVVPTPNV